MLFALSLMLAVAQPPAGKWSIDETGKVPAEAMAEFDGIARQLDSQGFGQLGLVVVHSTKGENPRAYATKVFNQMGIGHRGRNDGVLLFFALDDRKSEIVLGDGFPGGSTSMTDAIMRDDVVVNMRAGRLDLAITRSATSLAGFVGQVFAAASPVSDPEIKEKSPRGWMIELDYGIGPERVGAFDREGDAVYAAGKGMLFVALYQEQISTSRFAARLREKLLREDVWVLFVSMQNSDVRIDAPGAKRVFEDIDHECARIESETATRLRGLRGDALADVLDAMHHVSLLVQNGPPPKAVSEVLSEHKGVAFGGFGFTGLVGLVSLRGWMRRRPRRCEKCDNLRHKLNEQTDDPHLNPGQRMEEQLGSVDYDVWWCGRCNDAMVLRYGAIFTRYGHCEGCGHKTATSTSNTLVEATYSHGGTVEVTERCASCPHVNTYTRYTAQLTRSDDSSSSSYSSSSSSSFGGGSSSGSGSSGSW